MRRACFAKSFAEFVVLFLCCIFMSAGAGAQNLNTEELSLWQGAEVARLEKDSVLYLTDAGTAYRDFDASDAGSVLIYCDAGNYSGKGSGSIKAEFLDSAGEAIAGFENAVADDGSFYRFSFGSGEMYAGLPEGTAKVRLSISGAGGSGPYFRNVNVILSNSSAKDMSVSEWTVSGKLGLADVRSTSADYIYGVILVFLIALVMLAVRKMLDKIKGRK